MRAKEVANFHYIYNYMILFNKKMIKFCNFLLHKTYNSLI